MKTRFILLALLCFTVCHTTEAQLLRKIKQKAEQAAERTILKKTDEIVTGKTEKTIDDVANGNEKDEETKTVDSVRTTTTSNQVQTTPAMNPMMGSGNKKTVNLPESYKFDWEFKTEMTSGKNEKINLNYFINSDTNDFFGVQIDNEEVKGKGNMYMVMDNVNKSNVMFMDMNGQRMGQIHKMSDIKESKGNSNPGFKEIGTKEILGYTCYGLEVEDRDYIGTLYFTLDASVNFSALFAMANNKSAPKGFDPALLQVLKEDALLMEMNMTHKKKKNESFTMTAVSLNKKPFELKKKDYQFINMGF